MITRTTARDALIRYPFGLVLMTLAGYDPGAAPVFWRKMAAKGGDKPPELLSTHPSDETRIADLERLLPEVRAQYGAR